MKPAVANTRFTIPPAKLFHHVKQNTARIILNAAKASTIHGRYLPIFIKKVRITITPSSFAVLGIALSDDDDDESFSAIWVTLYCTTNNLRINKNIHFQFSYHLPHRQEQKKMQMKRYVRPRVST